MSAAYPPPPASVPDDLTAPTPKFKRHAWGAALGLALFLLLYFGLTGWFIHSAWRFGRALVTGSNVGLGLAFAIPSAFLAAIMVKGLFFVRHHEDPSKIEVFPEDEPELFAFVHRIADDAGAPKPNRIFLSNRVNAAVFYDLSFWNFVFPSKKNLEIGLGLVNVLSLDEFKAVVAHEFGHFAQRSMMVGSWVYLSKQFVGSLLAGRDAFDGFLAGLSRFDIRIAWIGWLMRLLVWSVRAILETAFQGVVILERALSREMEFQADLVSVSLCGSDSLVHALHRLDPADDAWRRAVGFSLTEASNDRVVDDVFTVQQRFLEHARSLRCEPEWGATPQRPHGGDAAFRVFKPGIGEVPRMWSSHPPSYDREENAKRRYLPSTLDERSAWTVFANADATRRMASERLQLDATGKEGSTPIEETLERLDALYDRPHLDARYRSCFLDRDLTIHAASATDLVGEVPSTEEAVLAALDAAYPHDINRMLASVRELEEEVAQLDGLHEGFLKAPGGVIQHRGEEVHKRDLPDLLKACKNDLRIALGEVSKHDMAVRAAHIGAARLIEPGWETYLLGLHQVLHYAEHLAADLNDTRGKLQNTLNVVMADGSVSESELVRLTSDCEDVARCVNALMDERHAVQLGGRLPEAMGLTHWAAGFPDNKGLFAPARDEIGNGWFEIMDNWVSHCVGRLRTLRGRALDDLVQVEAELESAIREGTPIFEAPEAPSAPLNHALLIPGNERERQRKLGWWDAFVTADGYFAGTARFAVAAAVLGPALIATYSLGYANIVVSNSLGVPVVASIDGSRHHVAPHSQSWVSVATGAHEVVTTSEAGAPIETLSIAVTDPGETMVYNVAQAGLFVRWTASYGSAMEREPDMLGNPHVFETWARHIFEEPPESISTKGSGGSRTVLSSLDDLGAMQQLSVATDLPALAKAHLLYGNPHDTMLPVWASSVDNMDDLLPALRARADEAGLAVPMERLLMDRSADELVAERCQQLTERATAEPSNADLAYLKLRCAERDLRGASEAWLTSHKAFPEHPFLALGAMNHYLYTGQWELGEQIQNRMLANPGTSPLPVENLAIQAVRLRRLRNGAPQGVDISDLEADYPWLTRFLWSEGPHEPDPLDTNAMASWQLAHGNLDASRSSADPELSLLRALSDGADSEDRKAALNATPSELGWKVRWPAYAMQLASGIDMPDFGDTPNFSKHDDLNVQAALRSANIDELEAATEGLTPDLRGALRVASIMRVGRDKAPAHWLKEANCLLFAGERPYWK